MREIKFRGKSHLNNEWLFGDLEYQRSSKTALIHTYKEDGLYNGKRVVKEDTVGQFTGLYDKNGTPIYEGDIVSRKESAFGYVVTGVVMFACAIGAFVLEYERNGMTSLDIFKGGFSIDDGKCTIDGTYSYEVIGNKFDNPELMK